MLALLLLAATLQSAMHLDDTMRATNTPSLAVAVVKDDQVIYQQTFGAPANARFYLASAAKPMTALAAKLTLDIDAPLTTTLPALKLPPPLDPARMSVRDLLTHRLGFDNDPVIWRTSYSGDWTDAQLFPLLERDSTVTPRVFRYDNLGYILTTYAIERAAGEPWPKVLRARVLDPLGMNDTSDVPCIATKSARTMNRGAGGLCTTIADMTRWLRVQMSGGMLDGKQLFPATLMRETHAPQIDLKKKFGRVDRYAYALGWYHGDYEHDLLMHHFGSYPGAWAHISWMPEQHLGVVVLSTADNPLADAVAFLAYDTLLGKADVQKKFDDDVQMIRARQAKIAEELAKLSAIDMPKAAIGTYSNDAYGTMTVGEKTVKIGDREAPLLARGDLYFVQWLPGDEPEPISFKDQAITWRDRSFARQTNTPR
jgi:CubicO group peptidase (beta-lactamase class C family)